jgi:large subunit ribosomal protein L15
MLTLRNIKSPRGSNKAEKRRGRGQGSGLGTQAGRGHKGQKARKSGQTRIGFIGGGMPLYMRLPKRGFKNADFKQQCAEINLQQLNEKFTSGSTVNREVLIEKKLIQGGNRQLPIKVLGKGKLDKALNFVGIERFSEAAAKAIATAGGKIETPQT